MNIFVMMPGQGRISELQERQMTTVLDENVYSIAIDGSSDDADVIIKGMAFTHRKDREENKAENPLFSTLTDIWSRRVC